MLELLLKVDYCGVDYCFYNPFERKKDGNIEFEFSYISFNFDRLPSWVGIEPESWLESKYLFSFHFLFQIFPRHHENEKNKWFLFSYNTCKLFKLPSWVGMVPESWLEGRSLGFYF